jgi:hypothetical protein
VSLIDVVEQLGAQLTAKQITHEDAVQSVLDATDLHLTRAGAEDLLKQWRKLRAPNPRMEMEVPDDCQELRDNAIYRS